jgi:hypothetical protein
VAAAVSSSKSKSGAAPASPRHVTSKASNSGGNALAENAAGPRPLLRSTSALLLLLLLLPLLALVGLAASRAAARCAASTRPGEGTPSQESAHTQKNTQ